MIVTEETWHEARLIPTSGISGAAEQERRATSALLAVMGIVKEFSKAVLGPLNAPAGSLETYIEVPFTLGEKRCYPDGLIRVSRGARIWTALVEVKTGKSELEAQQLENYLDIAHEQGFDALITISNEIPPIAGQHPTKVDKRKLRKVDLHHWSWTYLLSTAVMQKEHRGVSDPEQAWILGELIRYLEHPRSGAMELEDMGQHWVSIREAVTAGTLRASDRAAPEVVSRFDALLRYASLRLGRQLGTEVLPVLSRKEQAEPGVRAQSLLQGMVGQGLLSGAIRIPYAVAPIHVTADLRAGRITASVDIDAPREGRAQTRVNWLVRQLKGAPDSVRLEAFVANARGAGATELLGKVRKDPTLLIADPKRDLRGFQVAMSAPMGVKRGRGRGGFIDSVLDLVDAFYAEVVQDLKAWSAAPPRMREPVLVQETPAALVSTSLSSQDGPEEYAAGCEEPSASDGQQIGTTHSNFGSARPSKQP
ncbi:hypothetical protein [Nocardioides halotolerans]|uniref:hypothetical protein n=1 Tax=Nocardioides halotolerans TaxID=433660 RepID=UPI001B7F7A53|nr:hypothetical protein [Nocardioides halotolerans]